jgi:hypothetical protein
MQLTSTIEIYCGGPGSGRHKTVWHGMRSPKDLDKVLRHGLGSYKQQFVRGKYVYVSPQKGIAKMGYVRPDETGHGILLKIDLPIKVWNKFEPDPEYSTEGRMDEYGMSRWAGGKIDPSWIKEVHHYNEDKDGDLHFKKVDKVK